MPGYIREKFRHFYQTCKSGASPYQRWFEILMFCSCWCCVWCVENTNCFVMMGFGGIAVSCPKGAWICLCTFSQCASQMWFPFFREKGRSNSYCINSCCKSPCIFSVTVRDSFEEAVNYIQYGGHHSPSLTEIKGKSYHTPVQIHENQITRDTGDEYLFQLGFKSMLHKSTIRDF